MSNNDLTLGQKISNFRKRAGMSQLDLELEIGAGQGSISRIENDQVNPTKETIINIIKTLNLNAIESASLFNIDTRDFTNIVKASRNVNSSLDLDEVLQKAVDDIVYELNLLGSVIVLIEESKVYAKTFTRKWYTQLVLNIFNVPFSSLNTDLSASSENYFVKTILEDKSYFSLRLSDYTKGVLSDSVADLAQKISTHTCAISLPIKVNNKIIGGMLFSKNYVDDFNNEMDILRAFTDHIGVAIENAKSYENLKNELTKLKNGK